MGWQWHQLDHIQIICTLLQTDNHSSASSLDFFTSRMVFLMPHQQYQSTEEQVKWLTLKTGGIINNSAVWLRVNIICNVIHFVLLLLSRYASRLLQSVRRNLWMHRNEGSCHSTVKVSALFLHSFFAEKWCLLAELYTSFSKGVC